MSIARQFGSGVAWMALGNWAEQAINFGVFVILARILGVEAFGLLAMAAALVILAEFLVRESLSEYLIASHDPRPAHFNAVFWLLVGLGCLLTLALILGSGLIARLYGQPEVRGLIMALSPTVGLIALTAVPVVILRRELRFRTLSLRAIAGVAAGGIVGVSMALGGFGVWSLVGQRLAQVFINIVMAWFAVDWRPGFAVRGRDFHDVAGFGGKVLGLRAAELATMQAPSIIIGATLGPVALGLFSVAWRLVEVSSFLIVTPLRMAAQPAFAAMTRQGDRAADLLLDISKLSGLAAFPAFFGLAVQAKPVLLLVFGPQWVGAAPVLSVMAMIGAYLCIEKVNQSFCLAAGKAGAVTLLAWVEVVLASGLIWVGSHWGITAVGAGFLAAYLLVWGPRLAVVAGIAGLRVADLVTCQMRPLAAAIVMVACVMGLTGLLADWPPVAIVGLGAGLGVLVYAILVWLTMRDRIDVVKTFLHRPAPGLTEPA